MSGVELIGHLKARNLSWPIVLITGHGDVDMAVSAIKTGAFDFIEKPCDEMRLLASIKNAVQQSRQQMSSAVQLEQLRSRFNALSPRQYQVMELIVAGLSSKEIGMRLHLSAKTVNNHLCVWQRPCAPYNEASWTHSLTKRVAPTPTVAV